MRRRRTDFRRIGDSPPPTPALSGARNDHLRVAAAWRRAAGEALARHVEPAAWTRGTLTLRARDPHWATAVRPLLEDLLGRVARDCPEVGLRRYRLEHPGGADEPRSVEPAACASSEADPGPSSGRRVPLSRPTSFLGGPSREPSSPEEARARLERLRDLYLDAASGSGRDPEPEGSDGV